MGDSFELSLTAVGHNDHSNDHHILSLAVVEKYAKSMFKFIQVCFRYEV